MGASRRELEGGGALRVVYLTRTADRLVSLFIELTTQETGLLSERERARHFPMLTDDEVAAMERAVRETMLAPDA